MQKEADNNDLRRFRRELLLLALLRYGLLLAAAAYGLWKWLLYGFPVPEDPGHLAVDLILVVVIGPAFIWWVSWRAQDLLKRHHRTLSALYMLDRTTSQSLHLDQTLAAGLDAALEAMNVDAGGIFLVEADGEALVLREHRGLPEEFVRNIQRRGLGEGISGRAWAEKSVLKLSVRDYPDGPMTLVLRSEGLQELISGPFLVGGDV
ncbi:MAG: GAF domain-containing protein, partial [Dehalococcoidia bacterium]|nr:GAF domain-containing protein [Dehalococcoidia bacterium]